MKKRKDVTQNEVVVNGVTFSPDMKVLIKYPASKRGKSYSIPEPVEKIAEGAFADCKSLASIYIPDNLEFIGLGAFYGCTSLKEFRVGEYNYNYYCKEGQLYDAQKKESVMDQLFLPDIDYRIPDGVASLSGLNSNSMDEANGYTDYNHSGNYDAIDVYGRVLSVTIPKGFKTLDKNHFCVFSDSTYFKVEPGNRYFKEIDGVLSSKDGKQLLAYPAGRDTFKYKVPEGVEVIGEKAFVGCKHLHSIELPKSLKTIKRYAFKGLDLSDITVPENVTKIGRGAFEECEALASIKLPEGLKVIDDEAFFGCGLLSQITIPDSVEVIGEYAFEGCNLSSIRLGPKLKAVLPFAFHSNPLENIEIGSGVEYIGNQAFARCTMSRLVIPDNVKTIEDKAFAQCNELEEVHIGSGLTNIRGEVFSDKGNLKRFTVSDGNPKYASIDGILVHKADYSLKMLPPKALTPNRLIKEKDGVLFYKDKLLLYPADREGSSYTVPEGIKEIADSAFEHTSLEEIKLPSTLLKIGSCAFLECTSLKKINLPDGLEELGDYAFLGCISLESIRIPGSLEKISEWAFSACQNLKSISIGEGITSIETLAFGACESLTDICIPESVALIKSGAFADCKNLRKMKLPNTFQYDPGILNGCNKLSDIQNTEGSLDKKLFYEEGV